MNKIFVKVPRRDHRSSDVETRSIQFANGRQQPTKNASPTWAFLSCLRMRWLSPQRPTKLNKNQLTLIQPKLNKKLTVVLSARTSPTCNPESIEEEEAREEDTNVVLTMDEQARGQTRIFDERDSPFEVNEAAVHCREKFSCLKIKYQLICPKTNFTYFISPCMIFIYLEL